MSVVSKPKILSLPDEAFYPVDNLLLFDRHNRLTWEGQFKEQAPSWDKARQIKRWADTSVLEGVGNPDTQIVEYNYFDLVKRSFQKLKITVREAAAPNLPGKYIYPKYVVESTTALVVNVAGGPSQPLNPATLCQKVEAEAIVKEIGVGELIEAPALAGSFRIDWQTETRRRWLIKLGEDFHSAPALILDRNREGVGSPGQWVLTSSGPRWVSYAQDTGEQDPRPEIPIPCRLLFDQEALYLNNPMKVVVYRRDKESEYNPSKTQSGGGLTKEQADALARIDANVQQVLALELVNG